MAYVPKFLKDLTNLGKSDTINGLFSEEEHEWIVKTFGHWYIKEGCPAELREEIQHKLDIMFRY